MGFTTNESVLITSEKILRIVSVILSVDSKMKDLIKSLSKLIIN
jgi:hypothetical protein